MRKYVYKKRYINKKIYMKQSIYIKIYINFSNKQKTIYYLIIEGNYLFMNNYNFVFI